MVWLRSTPGRLTLLAVLVILLIAGNIARGHQARRGFEVEVYSVSLTTFTVYVQAPGTVEAADAADLRAPLAGLLAEVHVEAGDQVRVGDVVARYDAEHLWVQVNRLEQELAQARAQLADLEARRATSAALIESQIEQAESRVRQARLDLKRVLHLAPWDVDRLQAEARVAEAEAALAELRARLESEGVSDEQLAAARSAVEAAEVSLRQARARLVDAELHAPIDGTVLEVNAEAGELVGEGQLLVRVADLTVVEVVAEVDEIDIGRVAEGLKAEVTSLAFPGASFSGRVTRVAPIARRTGDMAVFDVMLRVSNEDMLLRPGMSVRVRIESERREGVLTVPYAALTVRRGRTGVFLVENGRARFQPVETDASTETEVVVKGLASGDVVVCGPPAVLRLLSDGERVRMRGANAGGEDAEEGP
jgi:HlyD family secretion protein